MDLLRIDRLHLSLLQGGKPTPILAGMSLTIKAGETVALVGESGSGKSMTALSIMRLLPKDAHVTQHSVITWQQQNLLDLAEVEMRQIRGRKIAMIFQEPMTSLNPVLTIEQQIFEVLKIHFNLSHHNARGRILELLDAVGIPDPHIRLQQYPHQLSGGMKQRVMIAMALAGEPQLLIADEPTTALDVTVQAQVLALLKKIQKQLGMSILLITHDLGVVHAMADRVLVMYAGNVVESATHEIFFSSPKHPYSQKLFEAEPKLTKRSEWLRVIPGHMPNIARYLSHCRFAPRCDYAWELCYAQVPRWLKQSDQSQVRCHLYDPSSGVIPKVTLKNGEAFPVEKKKHAHTMDEPLLSVSHLEVHFHLKKGILQRHYATIKAVDDVTLHVFKGTTLAIVGESGCGKTTLAQAIIQLIPSTAGKIVFQGKDLQKGNHKDYLDMRRHQQIIFQDPFSSMNPRLLVGDIIAEGLISLKVMPMAEIKPRVIELLAEVGLPPDVMNRYPHQFSGGQRQRIAIARALAVKPDLIICDEPTSALDVSVQAQVLNLLKKLQIEHGISFLFITHNIAVVAYLADQIAVMYLGKIVETGSVQAILEHAKHPYTQALLRAVPTIENSPESVLQAIEGEIPSPTAPPSGCHFHPRCPYVMPKCRVQYPAMYETEKDHKASCYLYEQQAEAKSAQVIPLPTTRKGHSS